jgi:hypothetical protein
MTAAAEMMLLPLQCCLCLVAYHEVIDLRDSIDQEDCALDN